MRPVMDMQFMTQSRGVEQSVARRAHNPKVVGSSPSPATNADVAQSVERILGKDKVTGSIPVISSSGGVAQLARASGSYPLCPQFKSVHRHHHLRLTPLPKGLIKLNHGRLNHEDEYHVVLHRMQESQLQDEQKQKEYARPHRAEKVLQILQEAYPA